MTAYGPTDNYVSFLEAKLATEIGPHEAKETVEEGTAILLDVRSDDSWNQGHAVGAQHIPRKLLAERLAELPRNKTIIAYCSDITCQSSLKATLELRRHGLDAKHMTGGYERWVQKGYPTTVTTTQIHKPQVARVAPR